MALILVTIYIIFGMYLIGVNIVIFYILFWEMEHAKDYPKIGKDLMWTSWFWFFINLYNKL